MTHTASRDVLILEVYLVIQERHNQTSSSTASSALFPLVAANGVIRVDGTLALLVQATQHGVCVVREETLVVEDGGETLGACVDAHRLSVAVAVDLADSVELITQGVAVGGKTNDGEDNGGVGLISGSAADFEELRGHAGVDAVAAGMSGIAGHDGEFGTGDGKCGATIVRVAVYLLVCNFVCIFILEGSSRVETTLTELVVVLLGDIGEGVVGPVHYGVLAKHGSHLNRLM